MTDPTVTPTEELPAASIQVGAAGLSAEKKEQEEKEQDPTVLPTAQIQAGSVSAQNKNAKLNWRAILSEQLESLHEILGSFLVKEDEAELQKIADILGSTDENNWDSAITAELLPRIEKVRGKASKLYAEDKRRGKMVAELEIKLDGIAMGSSAEAEKRQAEAKKIAELVSEVKTTVTKLEEEQSLIPIEENVEKWDLGKKQLLWVQEMLKQQSDHLDHKDLVSLLVDWNYELLTKSYLNPPKDKKTKTTMGRKPLLDFDNLKVERFIFNPPRSFFSHLIAYSRDQACDHPQYVTVKSKEGQFDQIHHCHLLEFQRPLKQPPRWFVLEVRNGSATAEYYMRSDNLYMSGFANQNKQIYELTMSPDDRLLKDSVPFECDCDYISIMDYDMTRELKRDKDKDVEGLMELVLNMPSMLEDVIVLSKYDHTKADDTEAWKKVLKRAHIAIGRAAIVFPEVCRLLLLFACVDGGWFTELGSCLDERLIFLMRHWKDMSEALRNWTEGKQFSEIVKKDLGMTYAFEAFEMLYLVLNAEGTGLSSKDKPKGDGPKPPPPPGPENEDGSNQPPEGGDDSQVLSCSKGLLLPTDPLDNTKFSLVTGLFELFRHKKCLDAVREGLLPTARALVEHRPYISSEEAIKFQLSGQCFVEIFSIHTNCPFIKSISMYDDRCGKNIYKSSSDVDIINFLEEREFWLSRHIGRDSSDYMGELVITGPGRAMSALIGFIIEVDVGDKDVVFDLSWSWEDRTVVDKPIVQSIFTSRGDVHVTAAVMSNALQAYVKFLFSPSESSTHFAQLYVAGTLVLKIENFAVGIKIFQSCWNDPARLRQQTSNKGMTSYELPLTRDVFVLPVGCGLRVTGALAIHVGRACGLRFHVSVDQSIEFKGRVGSCRWQLGHCRPFSHASICINAISPF